MDGEPDETTAVLDVESTMILPFLAVTDVVPESVTAVPDGRARGWRRWNRGLIPASDGAGRDRHVPAPQIALNSLGELVVTETANNRSVARSRSTSGW